jgi:hypothetical protein
LANKYLVGVDTSSSPPFSLGESHAYSVLGTYPLKDSNGNVVYRLLRIRNPWATDSYSGPWKDGDSRWTAAFKA